MKAIIKQMRAKWNKRRLEYTRCSVQWCHFNHKVQAADEILKALKPCVWKPYASGGYETGCGIITDLSPDHPKMKYCAYCGMEIEEVGK